MALRFALSAKRIGLQRETCAAGYGRKKGRTHKISANSSHCCLALKHLPDGLLQQRLAVELHAQGAELRGVNLVLGPFVGGLDHARTARNLLRNPGDFLPGHVHVIAVIRLTGDTVGGQQNPHRLGDVSRVHFLPTASGSTEYGEFFTAYLKAGFDRPVDVVPIYRRRDARRARNLDRLDAASAIYLGGGVTDHILESVAGEPALEHLRKKLTDGGVVVAIAAAAQAFGVAARSIFGGNIVSGFGWLAGGVVEPNFDPGHDRRLRELLRAPGVSWGLGIPAGSAVLLGPDEKIETVGTVFGVEGADGDLTILAPTEP